LEQISYFALLFKNINSSVPSGGDGEEIDKIMVLVMNYGSPLVPILHPIFAYVF